jgi:hypothetical protein
MRQALLQLLYFPGRTGRGAKKIRPLVVIDTGYGKTTRMKKTGRLTADQSPGPCNYYQLFICHTKKNE